MTCPTSAASTCPSSPVASASASSSAPVVLKDRDDGIAVAILRPVIAAKEPAVMIGRVTPLAFIYTDFEADARTVRITPLAGGCTFNLPGPVIVAYGGSPGRCQAQITAVNREGTERTTKTFEVEVVQRLEDGNLPPGSLLPTYDGIAPLAPAPPAELVTVDTLFHCVSNSFIIKFREGSGVRVRNGGLVIDPAASWGPPRKDALKQVQDALASASRHALLRMEWWNNPEHKAEAARIEGIIGTGQQAPDQLLKVRAWVDVPTREKLAEVMNKIAATSIVERVTPQMDLAANAPDKPGRPLPWPDPAQLRDPDMSSPQQSPPGVLPQGGRPPISRPPQ